ncbi:hypothetical protein DFH11DRAFT_1773853 [Phellopilus nigrolimitatus]|nr:hypothetical protein DFH11DRAFT_1773853 [Phellopilus nigrolimitatus]
MEFDAARAQRMQRMPRYSFDVPSASVLTAWENSQHQPPFHRTPTAQPETPCHGDFSYRPTNNFSQFPISPISPTFSSPPSSSFTFSSPSPLSSSALSEFEIRTAMQHSRYPSRHTDVTVAAALPTNHLFDFDFSFPPTLYSPPSLPTPTPTSPTTSTSAPASPALPIQNMDTISASTAFSTGSASSSSDSGLRSGSGSKRPSSITACSASPTSAKRARACMSTKDFVPPDVSGLSKREARLVKNRAAAFLSRQRKREEFELMEIRVAELEEENERLRDLAEDRSPQPQPQPRPRLSSHSEASPVSSELDHLRVQLAAARQREAELARRLETSQQQKVKTELCEPVLSEGSNSGASTPILGAGSPAGASLGLMVLLCALPSLLSHPSSSSRSTLPTSQSFMDHIQWDTPGFFPAATEGAASALDWECDWPGSGSSTRVGSEVGRNMDMDVDCQSQDSDEGGAWKKLEFEGENSLGLGGLGLGALDISFDTRRTKDGKILVRVHPSSQSSLAPDSSSDGPLPIADPSETKEEFSFSPLSFTPSANAPPSPDYNSNPLSLSFIDSDPLGPFLGVGSSPTPFILQESPLDFSSNMSAPQPIKGATRRRVRIALKGLPHPGGEGGEWEVEVQ